MARFCRWWDDHESFDAVAYHTDCGGSDPLKGDEHELARLIWKLGLEYCPFCGNDIDYCELSEVIADDEDDREYREGVRYGLYGY